MVVQPKLKVFQQGLNQFGSQQIPALQDRKVPLISISERGLGMFFEHVFFTNVPVLLLLEKWMDDVVYDYESKRVIDLDFIEH